MLQIEINSTDYHEVIASAKVAAQHADIIKLGDSCLKVNGFKMFVALKSLLFEINARQVKICVDLKTVRNCFNETKLFLNSGADIITTLSTTNLLTIQDLLNCCKNSEFEDRILQVIFLDEKINLEFIKTLDNLGVKNIEIPVDTDPEIVEKIKKETNMLICIENLTKLKNIDIISVPFSETFSFENIKCS